MLNDITLGQYFPGNSPIHRMDPRMKLILTILYIVGVFIVAVTCPDTRLRWRFSTSWCAFPASSFHIWRRA